MKVVRNSTIWRLRRFHGHGGSVVPRATDQGGGRYLVENVYLFMPGQWELRMTFNGELPDTATAIVDIP